MAQKSLLPSTLTDRNGGDVFRNLQSAIDKVFEDFNNNSKLLAGGGLFHSDHLDYNFPKTDVSEVDNKVEVEVELPGVEQKDVEVTIDGQYLVIKGERDEEKKTEKKNYRMVERSRGNFQRTIPLGFDAQSDAIEASFAKGILTVSVAKPPEAVSKARKIEIKQAEPA